MYTHHILIKKMLKTVSDVNCLIFLQKKGVRLS